MQSSRHHDEHDHHDQNAVKNTTNNGVGPYLFEGVIFWLACGLGDSWHSGSQNASTRVLPRAAKSQGENEGRATW